MGDDAEIGSGFPGRLMRETRIGDQNLTAVRNAVGLRKGSEEAIDCG